MEPYRILLAEDHRLFREFLKKNLEEIAGIEVVGEVGNGLELLESIKNLHPHMVILDIEMPILSGIEAARAIKKGYPEIKILLLTMYKDEEHLNLALKAKVDGYLLKENMFNDLVNAIEMIRNGQFYISDILSRNIVDFIVHRTWDRGEASENPPAKRGDRVDLAGRGNLSPREIEVLTLLAQGKSVKDISAQLSISLSTTRNHLTKIKKKLALKKNVDLIRYAFKKGYASISS